MIEFYVTARQICALKLFAGSDQYAYLFYDVGPDVSRMFATDGSCALFLQFPHIQVEERHIGRIPINYFKFVKVTSPHLVFDIDDKTGEIICGHLTSSFEVDKDNVIPMHRYLPNKVSGHLAQFDPERLVLFKKAAQILEERKNVYITIAPDGPAGMALVTVLSNPDFFGIITPLSIDPKRVIKQTPDWVKGPFE